MIKAVEKALIILEILEREKLIGVTQIANRIDINKSSVYRILETLQTRELVEKDELTNKYKLGLGFLRFSASVQEKLEITAIAKPCLEELVEITQESAHLCILSKNKAVCIERKNSSGIINISANIGDEEPVHCSAVGKTLAAFLPEDKLDKILKKTELKQFTPRTMTSKPALLACFEKIRQQGYAIDDEEIYTGVRCVAAPVRDYSGNVIASVGVSGSAGRIQPDNIEQYAEFVKEFALKISSKLGYKQ